MTEVTPLSTNPYLPPDQHSEKPANEPRTGACLLKILVGLGVVVVGIGLLLPSVRSVRPAARRISCSNNLKQIGLALFEYEADHGALPPAYTVDENGRPLHSWRTLILPYLEQSTPYDNIDLSKPWDDPANEMARAISLPVYTCPGERLAHGYTTYLGVVGQDACLHPTRPRMLEEITDGPANTLIVIEAPPDKAVHWMCPQDADEALVVGLSKASQSSHSSVWNAARADGSVFTLSSETPAEIRRAMVSIAAGDSVREE